MMFGDINAYNVYLPVLNFPSYSYSGDFMATLGKFLSVFAVTQVPLGIVEGIFTVLLFNYLYKNANQEVVKIMGDYAYGQ